MRNEKRSRREFLRESAAMGAGLGVGLPLVLGRGAWGAGEPASERVRIGAIGVGRQGMGNLGPLMAQIVAVCDVDAGHLAAAKARVEKATGRTCAAYKDYRKLLDDREIDAVVISTPDHWHALPTIHACQAGKDVYVEKPLTHHIAEGRAIVQAARRYGRIVQTGSQQRSNPQFRLACELVRSGRLGKIRTVRVGIPAPNFKGPAIPDATPPPELDYDFWLGPAPNRPYNEKRLHYFFKFFWDYGGGQMTNWGAHHIDIAHWGLGMDNSGPLSAEAKARFQQDRWYETPEWCEVTYLYPNGVTLICGMGFPVGTTFEGEKGSIFVTRGKLQSTPPELITEALTEKDVHLYESSNHYVNWLECIKSRKLPICDVEIGHRSATACHLGNIAVRTGRKVTWDPVREQIVGDEEQQKLVSQAYRAPWSLPV